MICKTNPIYAQTSRDLKRAKYGHLSVLYWKKLETEIAEPCRNLLERGLDVVS
jgi:hypothetical protein